MVYVVRNVSFRCRETGRWRQAASNLTIGDEVAASGIIMPSSLSFVIRSYKFNVTHIEIPMHKYASSMSVIGVSPRIFITPICFPKETFLSTMVRHAKDTLIMMAQQM